MEGYSQMKKRNWSPEEKMTIVLEGITLQKSIVQICNEYKISQSMYYKWKDKFFLGAKKALSGNNINNTNSSQAEIDKMQKIIGKQTIIIDTLKKTENLMGKN